MAGVLPGAAALAAAIALTDADKMLHLRDNVESDLAHVWDEGGVSLDLQVALSVQYQSVRRFATMADTRTEVRDAIRVDFGLDPAADPAHRAAAAATVSCGLMAGE